MFRWEKKKVKKKKGQNYVSIYSLCESGFHITTISCYVYMRNSARFVSPTRVWPPSLRAPIIVARRCNAETLYIGVDDYFLQIFCIA